MSPRKKEQNEQLRDTRRQQILDAALTVYVKRGYNGTDMDQVAMQAGLAKGLMYYYFKTKHELFIDMFEWMMCKTIKISQDFMVAHAAAGPVERLVRYTWDIFGLASHDPRVIQFAMRLPFDASAVFGNNEWHAGLKGSAIHQEMLASIIQQGVDLGEIPMVNASWAANCFWTVYVSNLFIFSKMIGSMDTPAINPTPEETLAKMREIVTFCFQGLGLSYNTWGKYLEQIILTENQKGEQTNEGV